MFSCGIILFEENPDKLVCGDSLNIEYTDNADPTSTLSITRVL